MINFRGRVFETNSSSTHSITITPNSSGILDTINPINGVISLTGGEFGWEWKKFNSSLKKANYAAVYVRNDVNKRNMLVDVIKEHTGAKSVEIDLNINGYIDHQSLDIADKAFTDKDSLKNWLFNPESWLFTGNDNEKPPPNFYDVEFGIEYNYQLSVEGLDLVEKFETYPDKDKLEMSLYSLCSRHPILKRKAFSNAPEYGYWYSSFEDINKKEHSSLDKFEDNKIIFFETEAVYTPKQQRFKGYKIKSTKEFKFEITKI